MLSNEVNSAFSATQSMDANQQQQTMIDDSSHIHSPLHSMKESDRCQHDDHDSVESNASGPQSQAFHLQHTSVNEWDTQTQEMPFFTQTQMQSGNEYFSYTNNDDEEDIIRDGIDSNEKKTYEENSVFETIESSSKDVQGEAMTERDGRQDQERLNTGTTNVSSKTLTDEPKAKSVPTGEIPLVERLPSRNVTFQSATILTVPELSSSFSTCTNLCSLEEEAQCIFQGKPLTDVRVTGVVQQLVITNDAQGSQKSFIVLGDALFVAPKRQTGTLNRNNRYQPPSSKKNTSMAKMHMTPKKIENSTSQRNPVKTPSFSTSTISMKTPQPFTRQMETPSVNTQPKAMIGTSLSGKRRKLVTVKPKVHNSLLNRNKNLAMTPLNPIRPNILGKSRMNSTRPVDRRQQELVQKVKQGMHVVIVDVTNTTLEGCKVDDLIMIMGSIVSTSLPNEESRRYNMISALNVIQSNYIHSIRESEDGSKDTHSKPDTFDGNQKEAMYKVGMYVQARILQVVNGTDINLLQKALELRRKHVENTYNTS